MKFSKYFALLASAATLVMFTSCDEDPVIVNESELITTLIWTLTPVTGGASLEFRFTDLDGDGGNAPVIESDPLEANTSYNAALRLQNESVIPAEEITNEVEAEQEEHQFFFEVSGALNASVDYSDQDADGNPVGLSTLVDTGDPSTGTITIILRHEPGKSAAGVADGDITNAGGETDIQVDFPVAVQ